MTDKKSEEAQYTFQASNSKKGSHPLNSNSFMSSLSDRAPVHV